MSPTLAFLLACSSPGRPGGDKARDSGDDTAPDTADDTDETGETGETGDTGGLPDGDFPVTVYRPDRIQEGTTLFQRIDDPDGQKLFEVNAEGEILWELTLPSLGTGKFDKPEVMDVDVTPEGTLLVLLSWVGVYEIDREGNVLAIIEDTDATHDADRAGKDGVITVHGWAEEGQPQVVELDADGEAVWAWTGLSWYHKAPYTGYDNEGWMHPNTVERRGDGNTLVTLRNFNTVALVRPAGDLEWEYTFASKGEDAVATSGAVPGERLHEGHLQAGGSLLVATREPTRVVEVDRDEDDVVWKYPTANVEAPAVQSVRGVLRLPNGNTLITDSKHITEVSWSGVVWQMVVEPVPGADRSLYNAIRILPDGTAIDG